MIPLSEYTDNGTKTKYEIAYNFTLSQVMFSIETKISIKTVTVRIFFRIDMQIVETKFVRSFCIWREWNLFILFSEKPRIEKIFDGHIFFKDY